jgi:cyclophilin family peptidyl-prolyl cis-trans isomerase
MLRRQYAFPIAVLAIAAIAGIIVLIANSGGAGGGGSKPARPAQRQPSVKPPTFRLDSSKTYLARVTTNLGAFVIQLDSRRAPRTGGSFVTLVRKGFYDGLKFHRIAPGFVVQGGDPNGDGTGGPGYTIRERPPSGIRYTRGVVAMAKSGDQPAGTSGSQFFVVTGRDAGLPPDYALLGKVTKGLRIVRKMDAFATSSDGPPSKPIVMKKVTVAVH